MAEWGLHRFEAGGKRFAIDTETCFCFECDGISWDVLEHYPDTPVNRIYHLLAARHDRKELEEVVGELEWLRATRSILPTPSWEEQLKRFDVEAGLKRLTAALGENAGEDEGLIDFLLARSGPQGELELIVVCEGGAGDMARLEALVDYGRRTAALAGKSLKQFLRVEEVMLAKPPPAMSGHAVAIQARLDGLEDVAGSLGWLSGGKALTLERLAKHLGGMEGGEGRVIVRPGHEGFGEVAQVLDEAGFGHIELDLDGAYAANPTLNPEGMAAGLEASAHYYVERLLAHHYFRVDPIAPLFWRIYNGTPLRRADPSGTQALAVDHAGTVHAAWELRTDPARALGSLREGRLDEERVKAFGDVGVLTTQACHRCWARHLCGGGSVAVHERLTGSMRTPDEAWCSAQRRWMEGAVLAFNRLSAAGVQFGRMYHALGGQQKPSMFSLIRAAFRMHLGLRPLGEGDAGMLAGWESWNRAAYFLLSERAVFVGNEYEREMDATHPRPGEFEFIIVRKSGDPMGLLRLRPEREPGSAEAFVYFRDDGDYGQEGFRRSFRTLLKEAGGDQSLRRLISYAAPWETGLAGFLAGVGFRREGVMRDALYTKGGYHDVSVFVTDMG